MELWAHYGLAGLVAGATIALVWKVVDRAWTAIERRNAEEAPAAAGGLNALQCRVDPLHFQHIQEVHEMVSTWDKGISAGKFSCAWKDRDEIRDLLEAIRDSHHLQEQSVVATRELTGEVRHLATEIRTARKNGGA